MNIYKKQMKKLGLNTQQYSKLLNMPHDIVKNIVYDKGNYDMDIKKVLDENILKKHQELEKDIDNTRMEVVKIKMEDVNQDILSWYNDIYNFEILKNKLNVSGPTDFERNCEIIIDDKKASHWIYYCVLSKKYLEKLSNNTIYQFAKQLYDIIVNDNVDKYLRKEEYKKQNKIIVDYNVKKWFDYFDMKKFKKYYNLTNADIAKEMGIGLCTIINLGTKKKYTEKTLNKFYNYVQSKEMYNNKVIDKVVDNENNEIEEQNDNNTDNNIINTVEVQEIHYEDVKIENMDLVKLLAKEIKGELQTQYTEDYNKLKKLLISKLTDEEKELIELFGGKIAF